MEVCEQGGSASREKPVTHETSSHAAPKTTQADGAWKTLFATDATWFCRESGYTGIGTWRPHQFGGERVVAASLLDDFTASTLDAVTWNAVYEVDVPTHAVAPRMTEPNRIQQVLKSAIISELDDKSLLVDIGKTLTGYVEIHFPPLKEGQEIILVYGDHLVKGQPANQGQIDRYIASGKKGEVFRIRFNYHGFRYIKIINLNGTLQPGDIRAFLIHTDYKDAATFQCSDPEINAIHDMIQYALRCLSLGGYLVDCPQIERLGYGGDGNASTLTAQTMYDLSPLYTNCMQSWADCIREDGGMPHTAPNPYKAGGGPYWCGFIITASWNTYINYGDSRLIEKYYPEMQQWLGYVQKYTVDGLLDRWPDTDYRNWYLGDWATPEGVDQTAKPSIDIVNNCFVSVCYDTMEKIALFLGKSDDAAVYQQKKNQLRKIIQERFFDSAQNSYATGSQIDLIYPMLAQVTPESLMQAVTQTLFSETERKKGGHLATGLVGIPVLTEWAIKNGAVDWVYGLLKKRGYPGYLYMLENGATATWEHWNGARSHTHNCYNGIGSWFYQAIGGIRPDEQAPGYRRVTIAPQVPAGITWAKTSKETPYGTLTVDWEVKDENLHLNLTVLPGCTALLELPENVQDYTINGKNIKVKKRQSKEIGSGAHQIVYRINVKSNNNSSNQLSMNTLKVPYVPSLDGLEISDVAKRMATVALRRHIDIINWAEHAYKPDVTFDIARGDKELYIHYAVRGLSLRAMAGKDGEFVHPDSCVEFFMRQSDNMNYTNFEFNCIGTCLAARGAGRHDRVPFTTNEYQKIRRFTTVPSGTFAEKTGMHEWELTVAIPFELMGLDGSALPAKIRGNFYKCADETANPHYVTWSPILLTKPDYHCPEHFGEIVFI
jgi:alpha-L-rhamnosidase